MSALPAVVVLEIGDRCGPPFVVETGPGKPTPFFFAEARRLLLLAPGGTLYVFF